MYTDEQVFKRGVPNPADGFRPIGVTMTEYQDNLAARQDLGSYVAFYNLDRRHSSLDYLSPACFEDRQARPG